MKKVNIETEKIGEGFVDQLVKTGSQERPVVLITGASSGIGKLAAVTLAGAGYNVIATMRATQGRNAEVAHELAQSEYIRVIELDVADDESVNNAIEKAKEWTGAINVVVNNAAVWGSGIMEAYSIEQHKRMFDINYFGVVRLYNAVLPLMRKQASGLFINITSGASGFTNPYLVPYFTSKLAIESLTEGMQDELKPFGIDSVTIQPGVFDTGMDLKEGIRPDRPEIVDAYGEKATVPMEKMITALLGRIGKFDLNPQQVADGILKVIQMGHGNRPLRFPIDPIAEGTDVEFVEARAAIKKKWQAKYGF
jgi:NAD(P)-dependent dehydrogenase (short-subunit alcohol dehydrogenase family)